MRSLRDTLNEAWIDGLDSEHNGMNGRYADYPFKEWINPGKYYPTILELLEDLSLEEKVIEIKAALDRDPADAKMVAKALDCKNIRILIDTLDQLLIYDEVEGNNLLENLLKKLEKNPTGAGHLLACFIGTENSIKRRNPSFFKKIKNLFTELSIYGDAGRGKLIHWGD